MIDLWYKNAVIYCVDVETFMDSDGDGVGDFRGLAHRLDHLEALGVTCLWLLPFYPSPNRDNGYDITDFYGVDPRLGTLGDFVAFTHAARDRGLHVIVDLVVNHTSTDHPWFQQARSDPDSFYRDWYVWSKEEPKDKDKGVIFPGVQDSVWTWDETAEAWYFHRFYKHQADLNIANPAVREEIHKIMGFWLQLGVSGFRVDAVPFLIEYRGIEEAQGSDDPLKLLNDMNDFMSWRSAAAVMLAEANVSMDEVEAYFDDGDRMQMIFNFVLNQNVFLALAQGRSEPVVRALIAAPKLSTICQWATFLRNHDELDLGRLSDAERREVFAAFGPEPDMQLYQRGIRRRLAPMLEGDERRIKMAMSLMFALPGTPMIWYGEEIGMGDDLSLDERNSVRTPMQWADERNAGFSRAPADRLVRPVIEKGRFAYGQVNVADQRERPGSLMERVQRLVRTRRACPEVGWGECRVLDAGDDAVLALRCDWEGNGVVTLHNLADRETEVRIEVEGASRLMPLVCSDDRRQGFEAGMPIPMEPYGFRWLRIDGERR